MKKLLQFELHKLKKQKSLYICSALVLAGFLLSVLATFALMKLMGDLFEEEAVSPTAVETMLSAVSMSDFTLITGIFIALYVCGDYSQKTIKNIYSRGFSRTNVFMSKLIVCIAYIIIMFIITELFALAVGSALYGFKAQGKNIGWLMLGQLFVCIAYACFAFSASNTVKKTGVALAIVILIPMGVTLVLTLVDVLIKLGLKDIVDVGDFSLSDYWLDGLLLSDTAASVKKIVLSCILPVIYGALFFAAGFVANRKAEV